MVRSESDGKAEAGSSELTGKVSLEEQMQQVFSLLVSRSRGEAANEDVENVVSEILATTPIASTQTTVPSIEKSQIEQDTDDYDDLEEEPVKPSKPKAQEKWSGRKEATIESMRKDDEEETDTLDMIPLGKEGARMMVTFGDGHKPRPEVVSAALLGARRFLQIAVKDARALRRHTKEEYLRARKRVKMGQKYTRGGPPSASEQMQEAASADMLYRAMEGYDKLAYDPKCGFDIDQLRQLFPEEMLAYNRWNEMHEAYEASSKDNGVPGKEKENGEATDKPTKISADCNIPVAEGHLEERAAQFDARTTQMNDDWYMRFSEVRQGSFLPRKAGRKSAEERQWDTTRKQNTGRGRPKNHGNWESMSPSSIRFLHWVGFDPRSSLPPPNDETTEALGFLGYDFMGRIVEKAIYLRNVANNKDDKGLLLELQEGEQLEVDDIEKAINDSTIRPVPLYNASDDVSSQPAVPAQLYFGPGFEDRLEMEMEEFVSGKKRKGLTPEEQDIRKREDELFSKLADAPVALDGFTQVFGDDG